MATVSRPGNGSGKIWNVVSLILGSALISDIRWKFNSRRRGMERSCETTDCPDSADARSPDDKTEIPDLYAFLPASRAPTSARLGPVVDTAGQQRLLGALANALVRGQRRAVRGVACLPSRPWGWRSRRGLGVMLAGMAAALSRDLCKISLSDTRWGGGAGHQEAGRRESD